jgi:hypothetical protein
VGLPVSALCRYVVASGVSTPVRVGSVLLALGTAQFQACFERLLGSYSLASGMLLVFPNARAYKLIDWRYSLKPFTIPL